MGWRDAATTWTAERNQAYNTTAKMRMESRQHQISRRLARGIGTSASKALSKLRVWETRVVLRVAVPASEWKPPLARHRFRRFQRGDVRPRASQPRRPAGRS